VILVSITFLFIIHWILLWADRQREFVHYVVRLHSSRTKGIIPNSVKDMKKKKKKKEGKNNSDEEKHQVELKK
jgi:hypothetical protein